MLQTVVEKIKTRILCAWRKVSCGEIHDLFELLDTIGVIRFGRIRLVGHVARLEEKRNVYRISVT
jgi:hypothetical protein